MVDRPDTLPIIAIVAALCAAACGAKTGLDEPWRSTTGSSTEPPGCQWRRGPLQPLATDVEPIFAPTADNTAEAAVGTDDALFVWRTIGPSSSMGRRITYHAARVGFDGAQRGETVRIADVTANFGLAIIGPPEVVPVRGGFAMLTWLGPQGCRVSRWTSSALEHSAPFAPSLFCEDLASLDNGGLRVFVGPRPIGTVRVPTLRVTSFVDLAPRLEAGAMQRGADSIVARATLGDRDGVALSIDTTRSDSPLVALRVSSDGVRVGGATLLQPLGEQTLSLVAARVTEHGAIAYWSVAETNIVSVAQFSAQGSLIRVLTLPIEAPATPLRQLSVDATSTRLFAVWSFLDSSGVEVLSAQVFDRMGGARTRPINIATGVSTTTRIRATPEGALVLGTGQVLSNSRAFAATLRCER
jgi:hypothetical protein